TDGSIISNTARGQFPGVDTDGEIVTQDNGLKYIELVTGTGATPSGPGAVVEVHYTGYLVDGTKFDSSVDRGAPASFPLSNVIKGWTQGVGSMQVGGKRKLIIPYDLAYGAGGRSPVIPPKATLIFDVELLKIVSDPGAPAAPKALDEKLNEELPEPSGEKPAPKQ
ncbi:MAG: FKBP-type peptidyl-prolyl cis-trans isomerase, partial [Phycisphaerales bacterium]|nr:FKBP-type peptidyl-prolyl cis-trans isomerase [Phycisphaerales bacterium]